MLTDLQQQISRKMEDRDFLDTDHAQTKVDNIKLKIATTQLHRDNETRAIENTKAQGDLEDI